MALGPTLASTSNHKVISCDQKQNQVQAAMKCMLKSNRVRLVKAELGVIRKWER